MVRPIGRQGAVEEGVGAAPGRELGFTTLDGSQAGESYDVHHAPGTHFELRAWLTPGCFKPLERDGLELFSESCRGIEGEEEEEEEEV